MRIILALLVVVSLVMLVLPFLPVSEERQQQCVAELEYERCYHLDIDGVPAFYLNELSQGTTKTSASTSIDSIAWHREKLKGCWTYRYLFLPICKGRIQAIDPDIEEAEQMEKINANIHDVITRNIELLEKECQRAKRIERGFNYYLKVHNVTDEGYNAIAALSARSLIAGHERERVLEILQAIRPNQLVEIKMQRNYYLVTRDAKGRVKRTPCKPLDKEYDNGVVALQTEKAFMPDAARAIYYNSTTSDFISNSIAPANSDKSLAKEAGKTKPRNGHGILMQADGTYYDGMWEDGKRNGFGFAIDSVGKLRVGEWKDDKYRGERMVYTSDRIYGIDISRYQHDIGKTMASTGQRYVSPTWAPSATSALTARWITPFRSATSNRRRVPRSRTNITVATMPMPADMAYAAAPTTSSQRRAAPPTRPIISSATPVSTRATCRQYSTWSPRPVR